MLQDDALPARPLLSQANGRVTAFLLLSAFLASAIFTACSRSPTGPDSVTPGRVYINDSRGVLGTVDLATGDVMIIGDTGLALSDIAIDRAGSMFALVGSALYSVNTSTAATTFIGHSIPGGNALVFGPDGTLYGAGDGTSLYRIDPSTGGTTTLGNMNFVSGGDLAFQNGQLYMTSRTGHLVRVDLANLVGSAVVGFVGFPEVFGLVTGGDGLLYGGANLRVFQVDVLTGAARNPVSIAGKGLSAVWGLASQ
jgi:hypothetical protein